MKNLNLTLTAILMAASLTASAAAPDVNNYKGIVQGVVAKFDRDWQSLNPQGKPDPGALALIETIFGAFNHFGINGPTAMEKFVTDDPTIECAGPASPTCNGMKISVTNSTHPTVLFGQAITFSYDIVVWMDRGSGYERFMEGSFTPVEGTNGKGKFQVVSCGGCVPVGHTLVEFDATQATRHIHATMWDTKIGNNSVHVPAILDALYNPTSGDVKIVAGADQVCGNTPANDSICNKALPDFQSGYTAILHGNSITGNVYLSGRNAASTDVGAPDLVADVMCIKPDASVDALAGACTADGSDNFTGLTPLTIQEFHNLGSFDASQWIFNDVSDTPSF